MDSFYGWELCCAHSSVTSPTRRREIEVEEKGEDIAIGAIEKLDSYSVKEIEGLYTSTLLTPTKRGDQLEGLMTSYSSIHVG